MVQGNENNKGPQLGALSLLNVINRMTKVTTISNTRLVYLAILFNRRSITAMVDTGIMYNFILMKDARRLDITLEEEELHMKAVNSEAKPVYGVTQDMAVKINSWLENVNFSMTLMYDFKMFLDM